MPTKITILYDNPTAPEEFEERYPDHLTLAKALPGITRVETSKVWPKEDGTPTPAYRSIDLYFDDYDAASAAVATEAAGALFPSVFGIATGGVTILFSDIEEG